MLEMLTLFLTQEKKVGGLLLFIKTTLNWLDRQQVLRFPVCLKQIQKV